MRKFGLIGKNIDYSFSRTYFAKKFDVEKITATYENFDCSHIAAVRQVLNDTTITGYNVTIPYKQDVIPFLDYIDPDAQAIGAVNTIKRTSDGKLEGYNTDFLGFAYALLNTLDINASSSFKEKKLPLLLESYKAMILGTGGASKAVIYALKKMGANCISISRKRKKDTYTYNDLDKDLMRSCNIIINTTPLGTFPTVEAAPEIPYTYLTTRHILFDLVYNPDKTRFMQYGITQGAKVSNGLAMLELQARFAWDIWNDL